jgi:hypothetical protein
LLQLVVLKFELHLEACNKKAEAEELIAGVRENLKRLPEDLVSLQIQARLLARDESPAKAVEYLLANRTRLEADEVGSMDVSRGRYFVDCLVGELQIRSGQFPEARKQLHGPSLNDKVGEAQFLTALSYATENKDDECVRFIDRAGLIHRRWCKIAGLRELYPKIAESFTRAGKRFCESVPDDFRQGAEGGATAVDGTSK